MRANSILGIRKKAVVMLGFISMLISLSLSRSTKDWARNKFTGFTITKYERSDSIDPALSPDLSGLTLISQETCTGSMITQKTERGSRVYIYYRSLSSSSIISSYVIKINVTFNLDLGKFVENWDRSAAIQKDVRVYKIDQELQLFPREKVEINASLRKVNFSAFQTSKKKTEEANGGAAPALNYKDVHFVHPLGIDLVFEDSSFVYRLLIQQETLARNPPVPAGWVSWIFTISLISVIFCPLCSFLQFESFWGNLALYKKGGGSALEENLMFPAARVSGITRPLSCFMILKHIGGVFSLFKSGTIVLVSIGFLVGMTAPVFVASSKVYPRIKISLSERKNIKKNCYFMLTVFLNVGWVLSALVYYRIILRTLFFYSALILLDLFFFMEVPKKLKLKSPVKAWLVVMAEGIIPQFFIYATYLFMYGKVHLEVPPLLLYYILPDLALMILMFLAFCKRFGKPAKKRIAPRVEAKEVSRQEDQEGDNSGQRNSSEGDLPAGTQVNMDLPEVGSTQFVNPNDIQIE